MKNLIYYVGTCSFKLKGLWSSQGSQVVRCTWKKPGLEFRSPQIEILWASTLTYLCLSFLFCKLRGLLGALGMATSWQNFWTWFRGMLQTLVHSGSIDAFCLGSAASLWSMWSDCCTIALISHSSKVMLKILQARLQQYMNCELPDVQAGFRKGRGTRDQIANIHWIMEKARQFQKNIYFCFIDYAKAFVWITTNMENS